MWTFLTIAGGVALILLGVRYLRKGLDRLFGRRLGGWMQRLTGSRWRAFGTGLGVSVLAPSSTTMSVLAVQSVQAGHISSRRALTVLFGADIGLTVTVQLIALRIEEFAPAIILLGTILFLFTHGPRTRGIGQAILAFGFIFMGILTIRSGSEQMEPEGDMMQILHIAAQYPLMTALLAAIMAMLLQSSTATIALMIGLMAAGAAHDEGVALPLTIAVAWVAGANVGVGLTTLLIGWARLESRRLALGNLIGKVTIAAATLLLLGPLTELVSQTSPSVTHQVANAHTGFNVLLALLGVPMVMWIARLTEVLVPPPTAAERPAFGPRYINLGAPPDSLALALGQSRQEILHMSEIVRSMLADVWHALKTDDARLAREAAQRDDQVDELDSQIKRFLTRLASQETDPEEAAEQMRQLRYVAELEAIGDVIDKNMSELALKKGQLGVEFSREGWIELDDFYRKVAQNMTIAETAFTTRDQMLAQQLLRNKQRLDDYHRELRDRHFERLNRGLIESHETSAIHLDLLTYLKRINGSVTHVAYAILQSAEPPRETRAE